MLSYFIHATVAMLAIVNPVAATPLFASITAGMSRKEKQKSKRVASVAVFVILSGAVIIGTSVLKVFGVGLDAFRFGGGLIIVLMGLDMLKGDISPVHDGSNDESDQADKILVPFAMPLVAGPGSIATAITLSATKSLDRIEAMGVTIAAVFVAAVALWISLLFSAQITDRLSGHRLKLLTRFMGLILVAVGAQFLLAGFTGFVHSDLPAFIPGATVQQP